MPFHRACVPVSATILRSCGSLLTGRKTTRRRSSWGCCVTWKRRLRRKPLQVYRWLCHLAFLVSKPRRRERFRAGVVLVVAST
ncbi:MAG: hypothetical protein [Microviridae sp.]|nr:MAG: hypothetical protein [Microviridae sp.]